ncbi:AlpA family phage regulatory protein [Bradyrhizobium sp. BRP20]|uniref:helix-turn-helix transcriptional regulator n=1 Tax=Bradyrhizobium sp. BRP20 TaxID=2793822 RepID=UPI001CD30B33|nr:AlpA family phage regulatory protein [Bradyrhizobium sp. BRP20]MCA1433115.1 AlpA family phage regulatory protein [Bradyrhizobium sp. BRP20]
MRNPKLLPFTDLRDRGVLLGRRQIDRLEAEGKFPKRVPIAANRVAWVAREIEDWVDAAIARRSHENATVTERAA